MGVVPANPIAGFASGDAIDIAGLTYQGVSTVQSIDATGTPHEYTANIKEGASSVQLTFDEKTAPT